MSEDNTLHLVVNLTGDTDADLNDQNFTLRSALDYAAAHAAAYTGVSITFDSSVFGSDAARKIILNSSLNVSEALLNKTITIDGELDSGEVISVTAPADASYRLLSASTTSENGSWEIELDHLNLSGGYADAGGCISVTSNGSGGTCSLELTNVSVSGGKAGNGGNLYLSSQSGSTLLVENSSVNNGSCYASENYGGGIEIEGSGSCSVTILNSTLFGNSATYGGAIGTKTVSTINIVNSTLAGNSANTKGGAITFGLNKQQTVNLLNSIVLGNNADSYSNIYTSILNSHYSIYTSGEGGGTASGTIHASLLDTFADLTMNSNSEIRVLCAADGTVRTISGGSASQTGVLVKTNADRTAFAYSTDGGVSYIDAFGTTGADTLISTDQHGEARGDDVGAIAADVQVEKRSLTVTTAEDVVDSSDGLISLREALLYMSLGTRSEAEGHQKEAYIDFKIASSPVISITSSLNVVNSSEFLGLDVDVTIDGANPSGGAVTIDAGRNCGIFYASLGGSLTLNNMTLKNGVKSSSGSGGGAIETKRDLYANNVTFCNCNAGSGGAIFSYMEGDNGTASVVQLTDCSFSGNTAQKGGALYVSSDIIASAGNLLFTGNMATSKGGAVYLKSGAMEISETLYLTDSAEKIYGTVSGGTIDINASGFGSNGFYKVIDAADASLWNSYTYSVDNNYETYSYGSNLYIKSESADFSTVIVSAGGTVNQLVISGETITGIACDFDDVAAIAALGVQNKNYYVDAGGITSGTSFCDFDLSAGGTLTVVNGGFADGSRAYLYSVVDTTLSGSKGDVVKVTVNGESVDAVFGINAFTSTSDAEKAHAEVSIVNVNEAVSGSLGGGTLVIESGSAISGNLYGADSGTVSSVDLTLRGASSSKNVLGGGSTLDSAVTGNIDLTITGSTVDRFVYGGGQSGTVTGSITTTVSDGCQIGKNFYGGSLISDTKGGNGYAAGAVIVDIEGGSFNGHIIGGSRINGSTNAEKEVLGQTVESVALNITGGTFNERASVFAGGYVVGGTAGGANLTVNHGVTVTLNADLVTSTGASGVYGGAFAGSLGNATVSGGVTITVKGGRCSNVWGGGWAESNATSIVSGNVAINVTGGSIGSLYAGGNNDTNANSKACVNGDVTITLANCTVDRVYASSKWYTSSEQIDGSTKVTIKGGVDGLDVLSGWTYSSRDAVSGSQTLDLDASVSCGIVKGFDVWDIAAGATLATGDEIDLSQLQQLVLGGTSNNWTIATGTSIENLAAIQSVSFGGAAAAWDDSLGCWCAGNYKLAVEGEEGDQILRMSKITA